LASFSPYFLLFGKDPKLPTSIRRNVMIVINLDDPSKWVQTCEQWVVLFKWVMPMAIENLTIVQHQDILQYAMICGGGY
jgi:hypothetical protein